MVATPIDYANKLLDRADVLANAAVSNPVAPDSFDADLLRSAWTFAGAAIDTYFHQRVRREMLTPPISRQAAQFSIGVGDVEDIIEAFMKNREKARPRVKLKNALHRELLKVTFQGPRNIENAFGLIGVSGYWPAIAKHMGEPVEDVKSRLHRQYGRRNRIVHEGDFRRLERPQVHECEKIDRTEVLAEIDWTRLFLHAVASET